LLYRRAIQQRGQTTGKLAICLRQCDTNYGFSVIVRVTVTCSYTCSYWIDRKSQSWPAATINPWSKRQKQKLWQA